jgi:DNA replication protein DnaC
MLLNVPSRYKGANLATGKQTNVIKHLRSSFTKDKFKSGEARKCFVYSGAPGCGKTYAIWALVNAYGEAANSGTYIPEGAPWRVSMKVISPEWFNEYLYATPDMKVEMLKELKYLSVLCIDDLGMEPANEKIQALIESIIDYRYRHEKPMIITTNLSKQNFMERYSERIIDRLREWGVFYSTDEKSLRSEKGALN